MLKALNKKNAADLSVLSLLLELFPPISIGNKSSGGNKSSIGNNNSWKQAAARMAALWSVRVGIAGLALLILSIASVYSAYQLSELDLTLLPAHESEMPWKVSVNSDRQIGGASDIKVRDESEQIDFDFTVSEQADFPYVSFAVLFADSADMRGIADWSRYDSLVMDVRCDPSNIFTLVLHTFDGKVTRTGDFSSFRRLTAYFACQKLTRRVEIDLRRLEVQEWWLLANDLALNDRGYSLDKVLGFSFLNSGQSPRSVASNLSASEIHLRGRDWRFVYITSGLFVLLWVGFIIWCVRQRSQKIVSEVQEKLQQERPLVAYQQVPEKLRQDRDKEAVLRYMATQYGSPDLGLEVAVAELGISRMKINTILKEELGLTFTSYVNKLRLTEAARLLLEKESSVAAIAYLVGYNNASYFTTVFKKEYGCTPGDFRKSMADQGASSRS